MTTHNLTTANAETHVQTIPLCKINQLVATYPLGAPRMTNFPFQLNSGLMTFEALAVAHAAFERIGQRDIQLTARDFSLELAAPKVSSHEYATLGIEPGELPRSMSLTLHILATADQHALVQMWLKEKLPAKLAKDLFFIAWTGDMQRNLKTKLPGMDMRGVLLAELDSIVLFDRDIFDKMKTSLFIREEIMA